MTRFRWSARMPVLVLGVFLTVGANAQQPAAPVPANEAGSVEETAGPMLEAQALNLLKAMSNRLASAHSMRFTAVASYENPSHFGQPLVYTTQSEVLLQRPDKLQVITPGDGPATEYYYDGKNFVVFSPDENFVSTAEVPPTIDAALEEVYNAGAIYFPFTDMIVTDPYKDIADDLVLAFYIGQSSVVGGTTTDMVAYETGGTFVQLWIGTEDKLPRMARAVFSNDPLQLRHQVVFSDWQLDIDPPVGSFVSEKAAAATPIPLARPDAAPAALRSSTPVGDAQPATATEPRQP